MPAPSRNATIALAAGGTGGHLFPAEALARELQRRGRAVVIYTERRGAQYAKALEGIPHLVLPARSLAGGVAGQLRSEEHTSELQSLMRNSDDGLCLEKKK